MATGKDQPGDGSSVMSKLQRRIISLLAGIALGATAAADLYGLHSCPHHDVPSAGSAHAEHAAAGPSGETPAGHEEHGPCTCVGACSANPPAAPLERPHVSVIATLVAAPVDEPAETLPRRPTTRYLHPWPNAPPLSASL